MRQGILRREMPTHKVIEFTCMEVVSPNHILLALCLRIFATVIIHQILIKAKHVHRRMNLWDHLEEVD
jgi:hypothetical protein